MIDKFQNSQLQQHPQQSPLRKQSKSYHNSIMSDSTSVIIATSPTSSPKHFNFNTTHSHNSSLTTAPETTTNNTAMQHDHTNSDPISEQNYTNSRFFDSSTLYKKELKQKQRDIISTSAAASSLSFANAISTTTTNESAAAPTTPPTIMHNPSYTHSSLAAKFKQTNTLAEEQEDESMPHDRLG